MKNKRFTISSTLAAILLASSTSATAAIKFEVGETEVSIYGFVMAKAAFDLGPDLGDSMATFPGLVPLDNAEVPEGDLDVSFEQTRIGFFSKRGDLTTKIEGDFYGSGGSFRVRHAYGAYRNWLVGKTWSNYHTFVTSIPTINFAPIVGDQSFDRFTQVRYTTGNFSLSAEDPNDAAMFSTAFADGTPVKHSLPRLTARYEQHASPIAWSVSAGLQKIGYDTGTEDDSTFGYGVMAGASYDFGVIKVRGGIRYGDGANTMAGSLGNPTGAYGDAYLGNGKIETIKHIGTIASASANLGPGTLNIGYGRVDIDYPERLPAANEIQENAIANYFWSPVEHIELGIEYGWFAREQVNSESGSGDRVSVSAMYSF